MAEKSNDDREHRDDEREEDEQDDQDGARKKPDLALLRNPFVRIGLVLLVIALVAGAIIWWLIARQYEDTDDAFIDTHIVHVSPQIAGQVLLIHVGDNQRVKAGQPLLEIDARNQQAQLEQALAQRL